MKFRKGKIHSHISLSSNNATDCKQKLSKVFIFRCLVFGSLLLTACLFGVFSYLVLVYEESENFKAQYNYIAGQILQSIEKSLGRTRSATDEVATIHGITHANTSSWPKSFIHGYGEVFKHINLVSNIQELYMAPIVKPHELSSFEDYVRDVYSSDPYQSSVENEDTIIRKVYGIRPNGSIYHDTTGETEFSNFNLITPVLNVGNLSRDGDFILFNLHSDKQRAEAIDISYECGLSTSQPCTVLTDFRVNLQNEAHPTTLMIRSIYPLYEPNVIVGFLEISLSWEDILADFIPNDVCGIDTVVSSEKRKFTFSLCEGQAMVKCSGDCHDRKFNSYRSYQTLDFNSKDIKQPYEYYIEVYPTTPYYESHFTALPWISTIVVVFITLFVSMVFFLYDVFVARESSRRQDVLEAKRRFVRFVSHEIRTPINSMVLSLELLIDTLIASVKDQVFLRKLTHVTKDLESSCGMAVMILNDLLQYDKIETGTLNLELKEIQIWRLIRRNVRLFRKSAEEKQIMMKEHNDGFDLENTFSHLGVNGDESRIAEVIGIIVSNAIKFSPVGSTIIIKSKRVFQSRFPQDMKRRQPIMGNRSRTQHVVFSVTDAGPGIIPENLDKIFDEGNSFNPNELQGGQSSGLGLWISKGIIELHGGHIWASCLGEGHGCTFFFQLPLIEISSGSQKSLSIESSLTQINTSVPRFFGVGIEGDLSISRTFRDFPKEIEPEEKKHKNNHDDEDDDTPKILIVDDMPMCRKILRKKLEGKGFNCLEAEDGHQSIKILREIPTIDYVLMDFQMPFMNGPAATRELRNMGFQNPVLGLTGNVMPDDIQEFEDAGADLVMSKPFQMEIFDEFIRSKKSSNKE